MAQNNYQKLHEKYISKMSSLETQSGVKDVSKQLQTGRTHVLKMRRYESSSFDLSWIKKIEECLFDLEKIVNNPRRTTKSDEQVVPIELARKIGAESIRHLASHTYLIKEIDENDNVMPSKILNLGTDDEYVTYENRFIATLIRRLVIFVEKRYDYVSNIQDINNTEMLMIKNKSVIDGMEVEIETKVKVTQPAVAEQAQYRECLDRIVEIRKYLSYFYNSDFMKRFKNERDVPNPILQTNIIRRNPEYSKCYRLYKFLESYAILGISYKVNETYANFEKNDFEKVNSTLLANFLALNVNVLDLKLAKRNVKEFKPKVLTSIDDEEFENRNRLFKMPVQFVRMDEEYQKYIGRKVDVPQYMKVPEKIYNEDEIALNKKRDEDLKQLRRLIKRKENELQKWQSHVNENVDAIIKEAEIARRKEELKKLREDEARIEATRKELIKSAKASMGKVTSDKKESSKDGKTRKKAKK